LPQQPAKIALPPRRPDIQPGARNLKTIDSRSGGKPDAFARTLDRQLDRKQATDRKQAIKETTSNKPDRTNKPDRVSKTSPETPVSKDKAGRDETISTQAPEDAITADTGNSGETSPEDAASAEAVALNAALINTPATPTFKAASPALAIAVQPGLEAVPVTPPAGETLPETQSKDAAASTGKTPEQKPAAAVQSSDLFSKELAAVNAESGSKVISDEAKARSDKLFDDTKTHKNPVGLLQKALSGIPGQQNSTPNGQAKIAPNAIAYANADANANFTLGTDTGDPSGDISRASGQLSITPQNAHAVSTKFGTAIQSNQSAQTAINSLAVQISRNVDLGVNRFQIRMDPPELGRIDVKLKISHDGRLTANMTVERPETLDLLMRDARALERALTGSGLNTDSNSLNFSLKDQSASEFSGFNQELNSGSGQPALPDDENGKNSPLTETIAAYRNLISSTAVDIRI